LLRHYRMTEKLSPVTSYTRLSFPKYDNKVIRVCPVCQQRFFLYSLSINGLDLKVTSSDQRF